MKHFNLIMKNDLHYQLLFHRGDVIMTAVDYSWVVLAEENGVKHFLS